MHKHYVIIGDLTKLAKVFVDRQRTWDTIAEFRTRVAIDLMNQHNSSPAFKGPVGIRAAIYMNYPKDIILSKRTKAMIHTRKPTMSSLLYFLEHIGFGILFNSTTSIAHIHAEKYWTNEDARVEMEIFTLK